MGCAVPGVGCACGVFTFDIVAKLAEVSDNCSDHEDQKDGWEQVPAEEPVCGQDDSEDGDGPEDEEAQDAVGSRPVILSPLCTMRAQATITATTMEMARMGIASPLRM